MTAIDTVASSMLPESMQAVFEARAILEDWLKYYDQNGHSTGLRERTISVLQKLPEPPRYIPTPEEVHRMENDCG